MFSNLQLLFWLFLSSSIPAFAESGCEERVERFCTNLYSPEHQGNIDFDFQGKKLRVRFGRTSNSFDYSLYYYSKAKLEAKNRLPADFKAALNRKNYFRKLGNYLNAIPFEKMTLEQRINDFRLVNEVNEIWGDAMEEVVLRRTEKRHPGYHHFTQERIPPLWKQDEQRTRDELYAQVNQLIWSENIRWKEVVSEAEKIRTEFIEMIKDRKDWVDRIKAVQIVVPGSDPKLPNLSCSSTERNAYYDGTKNRLTVCSGAFTTMDSALAVAHEFAHAIDVGRSAYLERENSRIAKMLKDLKANSCSDHPISCKEWSEWKRNFGKELDDLGVIKPKNETLLACLQSKKIDKRPDPDYYKRVAREKAIDEIEPAAASSSFISMIKQNVKLIDGNSYANPGYNNPCGLFHWNYDDDSMSAWYALRVFFSNEYRCSQSSDSLTPEFRLRNSIETAKAMVIELDDRLLKQMGKYSAEKRLKADEFADDPVERYADTLGEKVFAKILEKIPSKEDRWNFYLANIAFHCDPPSWRRDYPSEAAVEKEYYFDPHSEGKQRRKELLMAPIREALGCSKDFELEECTLN